MSGEERKGRVKKFSQAVRQKLSVNQAGCVPLPAADLGLNSDLDFRLCEFWKLLVCQVTS